MWGNHFNRQFFLLFQVSHDILQVKGILQVMASSFSSSSQVGDLESCEQLIANNKHAIKLCGQEISSDLSEQTKARIAGCLLLLVQRYEQEPASISSIKFGEFFNPLRSEVLDRLPELFEDKWLIWVTQMDDIWSFEQKK